MREAQIILPLADNNGAAYPDVLDALEQRLIRTFNGFTYAPATGAWVGPHNKLYREAVRVYSIAMEDTRANAAALRSIANLTRMEARQEAVYIRLPDGEVEFVSGDCLEQFDPCRDAA